MARGRKQTKVATEERVLVTFSTPAMPRPYKGTRFGVRFENGQAELPARHPSLGFLKDMGAEITPISAEPLQDEPAADESIPEGDGEEISSEEVAVL